MVQQGTIPMMIAIESELDLDEEEFGHGVPREFPTVIEITG